VNRLLIRKIHRWLGIIAAIQFLAWTISGFYFSLIPIEEIRGNHLLTSPKPQLKLGDLSLISPSDLIATSSALKDVDIDDIELKQRLDSVVYLATLGDDVLVFDAASGAALEQLNRDEAIRVASERTETEVVDAVLVTDVPAGHEYRGGPLPAWQVQLANDANIYVAAVSGQTRAVRTDQWRLFDLLWSFHIMDYDERDDFNHLLLKAAALLAIVTVLSGVVLFFISTRWRKPALLENP
jgi:uncharacterized iron-regulated membrane protein